MKGLLQFGRIAGRGFVNGIRNLDPSQLDDVLSGASRLQQAGASTGRYAGKFVGGVADPVNLGMMGISFAPMLIGNGGAPQQQAQAEAQAQQQQQAEVAAQQYGYQPEQGLSREQLMQLERRRQLEMMDGLG